MKKVLILSYSQTGQLNRVAESFVTPLKENPHIQVVQEFVQPVHPFPYPWSFFEFLDVFPECVYLDGSKVEPLTLDPGEDFDLIILAYQVWFLAPSLPVTGFLQTPEAKRLLKDKPVITLIACRNMWLIAQEKMKGLLQGAGARLLDNVVLTDQGSSLSSLVTTPRWLLTGKKEDRLWGVFPPAGVSEDEIAAASRFGRALIFALKKDEEKTGRPLLSGLGAVAVDEKLIPSEKMAHRSFLLWGRLFRKVGPLGSPKRKPLLVCYVTFLITFLVTFLPISMLVKLLLRPLIRKKIQQQKDYFEQPSGSGTGRMKEFT